MSVPKPALTRVLQISEPGKDGVFDIVRALIVWLHDTHPEITVDLAYSSRRGGASLPALVERVRARGGEAVDLGIGNAPELRDIAACREIIGLVHRHRPEVVHAHSSKAGGLARILSLAAPGFPPVVYMPHAYYGMGGRKAAAVVLFNAAERVLGRIGTTINCSPDERDFAIHTLRLPVEKLVVINNGIDLQRFHPATPEEKAAARAEFNLPAAGPILLTVGRDNPQKNYAPLYRAMESVLSDPGATCTFVHAGAGAEQLGYRLSPAARRRFHAFTHVDAIERLLRAADAFILTSRYEGLALSVLQALGSDLRLFLTRVPGNRCLDAIGFSDIGWIEQDPDEGVQANRIIAALGPWPTQPRPPGPAQLELTRREFNAQLQYEKIRRFYVSVASSAAP